jgi:hypothetical protein
MCAKHATSSSHRGPTLSSTYKFMIDRTTETNSNAYSPSNYKKLSLILTISCDKRYLYPSSLKKHYLVSHREEYEQYLQEQKSKFSCM